MKPLHETIRPDVEIALGTVVSAGGGALFRRPKPKPCTACCARAGDPMRQL
jgi:hypothetical protein